MNKIPKYDNGRRHKDERLCIKNAMQTGASLPETSLETIVLLRAQGWTVILQ